MGKFAGDKKEGTSFLTVAENKLKDICIPLVPKFIETYHLTLMTVLWSLGNFVIAFNVGSHLNQIWYVNLMIVLQYITDLLDGELGRRRNTGLIKWGFYMDHFLDYIFLCSLVFVGYCLSPNELVPWYFGIIIILGSFMVNSFLSFAATNKFEIYHYGIGPTETRLVFICVNIYIIYFGVTYFYILVPAITLILLIGLIVNTYQIHKKLWKIDMDGLKK